MIRQTLSHRIPYFPHRLPAALLFALSAFAAMPLHAGQGVTIESITVVKADADWLDVDIVASNDGSLGPIRLQPVAKSKDGTVRSNSYQPSFMPVGEHVHFASRVAHPGDLTSPRTDVLLVTAEEPDGKVVASRKFDWIYAWPAVAPKPPPDVPGLDPDYAIEERPWYLLYMNLREEDFAALDLLMEEWSNPKERDKNGEWKLDAYRSTLYYVPEGETREERLERLGRWKKSNPRSPGAAITEARYWVDAAWRIRGGIWNQVVDPVAMRVFGERMKRAEKALLDSKAYASGNPLWYETYLDLAIATKRSDTFIEALFEEAIGKHPHFQPLYTTMATRWAPRQGGKADWSKVDALVERAVSLTSGVDGQRNYARLYAQISELQRREVDILEESRASWPRMKDSFNELIKHYPSTANLNEFAVFACRAGDKETFLNLSAKIQGHIVANKWPDNYSVDLCTHRFMENT